MFLMFYWMFLIVFKSCFLLHYVLMLLMVLCEALWIALLLKCAIQITCLALHMFLVLSLFFSVYPSLPLCSVSQFPISHDHTAGWRGVLAEQVRQQHQHSTLSPTSSLSVSGLKHWVIPPPTLPPPPSLNVLPSINVSVFNNSIPPLTDNSTL